MQITSSVTISMRSYLSISHIHAAALFARKAYEIEETFADTNKKEDNTHADHIAYVTGAIFSSVAFLEALINEIFTDASESHFNFFKGLDEPAINLMSKMWSHGIPRTARYPILQKYAIALDLSGKASFNNSCPPYQDVQNLIELRNALIHYEPKTFTDAPKREKHKFEKALQGRFKENPLTGSGNPFYPDKCLSHGCAEWGVKYSIEFADCFFCKMGISPTYEHSRSKLNTK